MALNTLKCNRLMPLPFKGLTGKELCLQFCNRKSHCVAIAPRHPCLCWENSYWFCKTSWNYTFM